MLLARAIDQVGLIHYSARSLDTRRRVRVFATVPMSGACTRPKWRETGTTWISASGIGYPGVTCVDGFPLKHETQSDMASSWGSTRAWAVRRCVGGTCREVPATSQAPVIQFFPSPSNFALEFVICGGSSGKWVTLLVHNSSV